jgi:hypothetical protein
MTNAQLEAGKTSAVKTHYSNQENSFSVCRKPVQSIVAAIHRLWWHTRAYGTILGIMPLVLASLVFLHLYWLYRKLGVRQGSEERYI